MPISSDNPREFQDMTQYFEGRHDAPGHYSGHLCAGEHVAGRVSALVDENS
jgi:hypothetical protein